MIFSPPEHWSVIFQDRLQAPFSRYTPGQFALTAHSFRDLSAAGMVYDAPAAGFKPQFSSSEV
jgi:hypothetical protein